jgi:hypothetical protein
MAREGRKKSWAGSGQCSYNRVSKKKMGVVWRMPVKLHAPVPLSAMMRI